MNQRSAHVTAPSSGFYYSIPRMKSQIIFTRKTWFSVISTDAKKVSIPSFYLQDSYLFILIMRITGLEPARRGHQNLNLARLPIPPHPHSERAGIRTPDNLIKSQVLYHLSYTPLYN